MPPTRSARRRTRLSTANQASKKTIKPYMIRAPTYLTRMFAAMYAIYLEQKSNTVEYAMIIKRIRSDAANAGDTLGPLLTQRLGLYLEDSAFLGYIEGFVEQQPLLLTASTEAMFCEVRQIMEASEAASFRAELRTLCTLMYMRLQKKEATKKDLYTTIHSQNDRIRIYRRRLRKYEQSESLASISTPPETEEEDPSLAQDIIEPSSELSTPARPHTRPIPYPTPESQPRPSCSRQPLTPFSAGSVPQDDNFSDGSGSFDGPNRTMVIQRDDQPDADMAEETEVTRLLRGNERLHNEVTNLQNAVQQLNVTVAERDVQIVEYVAQTVVLEERRLRDARVIDEARVQLKQANQTIACLQLERRQDAAKWAVQGIKHKITVHALNVEREKAQQAVDTAHRRCEALETTIVTLRQDYEDQIQTQAQLYAGREDVWQAKQDALKIYIQQRDNLAAQMAVLNNQLTPKFLD